MAFSMEREDFAWTDIVGTLVWIAGFLIELNADS
jgi:steroid 5-alpha reductase family enzyme